MTENGNGQLVDLRSPAERRVLQRYRPSSVAYVNVGTDNGGIVLNISESGLQLSAGETLGWDQALQLSLQLSYQTDPIEATGQVIWLSDSKRIGGFQFVALTDEVRDQIRNWISGEGNATIDRSHPPEGAGTTGLAPKRLELTEGQAITEPVLADEPADIVAEAPAPSDDRIESAEGAEPQQGRSTQPAGEPRLSWFPIVVVCGLMVVCFAAGVIVGATWVAKAMGGPGVPRPSANTAGAVSESASESVSPSAESMATPAATASLAPVSAGTSQPTDDFVWVTPPDEDAQPELVTLPQLAVSASESVAISVRRFVLVPAAPGPASEHRPERLVGGKIAGPPLEPLPSGLAIDASGNVVRLRLSVDEDGELNDLIKLEGRADLVSIAEKIVRRWIQTPSRLVDKPIASIEDVTVTFRPGP